MRRGRGDRSGAFPTLDLNSEDKLQKLDMYKYLYKHKDMVMEIEKEIRWMGTAYADLLDFPEEPRRQAGFQLGIIQVGLEPRHWKPFTQIGIGAKELRINTLEGAFRLIYTDRFESTVYVLHCFRKTTQVTTQRDKEVAGARFRAIAHDREDRP